MRVSHSSLRKLADPETGNPATGDDGRRARRPCGDAHLRWCTIGVGPSLSLSSTGYGDLPAAAHSTTDGQTADITLTPQNGASVVLNTYALAGYSQTDIANQLIRILDSSNNVLFSFSGAVDGAGPSDSTFYGNITSSVPIQIEFGPSIDVGIDNINFDEIPPTATPEPSTLLLLAAGLVPLVLKRQPRA